MLRINERISIPLSEFQTRRLTIGRARGQNVNKVNSKVLLRWSPAMSSESSEPVRARLLGGAEQPAHP